MAAVNTRDLKPIDTLIMDESAVVDASDSDTSSSAESSSAESSASDDEANHSGNKHANRKHIKKQASQRHTKKTLILFDKQPNPKEYDVYLKLLHGSAADFLLILTRKKNSSVSFIP